MFSFSEKILSLNDSLEKEKNPNKCLQGSTHHVANLMDVYKCSIMLSEVESGDYGIGFRICANHSLLPSQKFLQKTRLNDGVAGHILATGKPLLVNDILASPYREMARRPKDTNRSFLAVPIMINGKVVGVMNLSDAKDQRLFDDVDLNLAIFAALLIGKSLHIIQLQVLLKSRFAQLALARETKNIARKTFSHDDLNPNKVAILLSRSFYREMIRNGFNSDHIISAASEIINQLTAELRSHQARLSDGR